MRIIHGSVVHTAEFGQQAGREGTDFSRRPGHRWLGASRHRREGSFIEMGRDKPPVWGQKCLLLPPGPGTTSRGPEFFTCPTPDSCHWWPAHLQLPNKIRALKYATPAGYVPEGAATPWEPPLARQHLWAQHTPGDVTFLHTVTSGTWCCDNRCCLGPEGQQSPHGSCPVGVQARAGRTASTAPSSRHKER